MDDPNDHEMCAGGAKGTASAYAIEKCAGGAKGAAAAHSGYDGNDSMGREAAAEYGMGKPQTKSAKFEFEQQGTPLSKDERMLAEHSQEQRVWWLHKGGLPPDTEDAICAGGAKGMENSYDPEICAGGAKGAVGANEAKKCAGDARGAATAQSGHDGDDV
eukprot:873939-Karenia_brevis.AAC.1